MTDQNPLKRGAVSWAMYDLANTIYSMNVVSLYFSQWVTVDRGKQDLWFSMAYGISMALVALTLPYFGLWADKTGRRLQFLAIFTGMSVLSTAALGGLTQGAGHLVFFTALGVFALSNYGFQGGLVFYNALLPQVSTPQSRGRISGLGTAAGYFGSIMGMFLVLPFVEGRFPFIEADLPISGSGRSGAFLPTAILFGLFALPIFVTLRDKRTNTPSPEFREAFEDLKQVILDRRRYPGVGRFLLANILLLEGVHTAILFMAVFSGKVMGLPDEAKVVFFILATVPAILGSMAAGWLCDRVDPAASWK